MARIPTRETAKENGKKMTQTKSLLEWWYMLSSVIFCLSFFFALLPSCLLRHPRIPAHSLVHRPDDASRRKLSAANFFISTALEICHLTEREECARFDNELHRSVIMARCNQRSCFVANLRWLQVLRKCVSVLSFSCLNVDLGSVIRFVKENPCVIQIMVCYFFFLLFS